MAYSAKVYPQQPAMRALHLSCGWQDAGSATNCGIAGGPVEKVNGYQDPLVVWQRLFLGLEPDNETPKVDPNLSFLNAVYEDYHRLAKSPRLGSHDKQLLDRHIGFLADIESRIKNFKPAECTPPGEPPSINAWHLLTDPDELALGLGLMIDLAVAAVICDLTRVVTLNVTNALQDGGGSWQTSLHNSADIPSDWHHYAHDAFASASSMQNLIALNRWLTKDVYARLLTRLDVPEGADGSTFLDNSLVVWGNELSRRQHVVRVRFAELSAQRRRVDVGGAPRRLLHEEPSDLRHPLRLRRAERRLPPRDVMPATHETTVERRVESRRAYWLPFVTPRVA
jgi:hypothetical protein